jgi:uncharacterized protein (TIGR00255 family)
MKQETNTINTASMTGFAREQGQHGDLSWVWEVKSANGKNADVRFRLPPGFESLETSIRSMASKIFARGNIQLSLNVEQVKEERGLVVNEAFLTELQDFCEAQDGVRPPASSLLKIKGVVEIGDPGRNSLPAFDDETKNGMLVDLEATFHSLRLARAEEGKRIGVILAGLFERVATLVDEAEKLADTVPAALMERFQQQLDRLLTDTPPVPEERVAQEIAILATKADIREELDRLRSHFTAAFELLAIEGPSGRKLDFLCQEFNREVNTLCSKSSDKKLTETGLELKAVVDQIKEQVQNIE